MRGLLAAALAIVAGARLHGDKDPQHVTKISAWDLKLVTEDVKMDAMTDASLLLLLRQSAKQASSDTAALAKTSKRLSTNADTLADVAETLGDMPRQDLQEKDNTVKAISASLLQHNAGKEMEREAEQPLIADPLGTKTGIGSVNSDLSNADRKAVLLEERALAKDASKALRSELPEMAAGAEFSTKHDDMSSLDLNGDGFIDVGELTAITDTVVKAERVLQMAASRQAELPDLQALVKTLDKDGDGALDPTELEGEANGKLVEGGADGGGRSNWLRLLFENADQVAALTSCPCPTPAVSKTAAVL